MHDAAVRQDVLTTRRAAGINDCEIARRTGLPRTTVRDIRAPRRADAPDLPPVLAPTRAMAFTAGEYAELLGLYLGDGHIVRAGRTQRLRIFSRLPATNVVVEETRLLIDRCFSANRRRRHRSSTAMRRRSSRSTARTWRASSRRHGPGKKHHRTDRLEAWQQRLVDAAPWSFLRGCIHSDGCFFINRTGPYRYLSADFTQQVGRDPRSRSARPAKGRRRVQPLRHARPDLPARERQPHCLVRRVEMVTSPLRFRPQAAVVKLVYTRASGARGGNPVEVRVLSAALDQGARDTLIRPHPAAIV